MRDKPTVAVINNEPTFRWTITRLLDERGYAATTHTRDIAAVDHVRETRPDVIVLEARYGSAVTVKSIVERLRGDTRTRYVPVILCSPDGRFLHSYGEYLRGQGCVVVGRPLNSDHFIELIDRATRVWSRSSNSALNQQQHLVYG